MALHFPILLLISLLWVKHCFYKKSSQIIDQSDLVNKLKQEFQTTILWLIKFAVLRHTGHPVLSKFAGFLMFSWTVYILQIENPFGLHIH